MSAKIANSGVDDAVTLIRTRIENLRPKLLDLTRRNPLVSIRLSPRSNSLVRAVDELPDVLAFRLTNQQKMRLLPLPALDEDPKDEQSAEFQNALSNARLTDEASLAAIEELNAKNDESIEIERQIERELRDRVRVSLDMPPRQTKGDVSLSQHAHNNGISPSYDLPDSADEHEDGRHGDENVQTLLLPEDLERKLNALITKCRTWSQETGINVLHAAFGFLEWAELNGTDSAFAPLLLLPITMEKIKTGGGAEFWISGIGDDAEVNLVLAEKLKREFAIELPEFEGGSVDHYLDTVANASPRALKWRIRRQVAFGVFPSARIAMYHDLDTSNHTFEKNNILARLLGGSDSAGATPFAGEYDVDHPDIECKVPCLVMDADSSQFSTIVDVMEGRCLPVEGPPGTGKSQTIVNTIAAAMALGKKVLFVAEKMAALEVVKSRLEAVGLGEYLLPLQADRSTREKVIQSVRDRLNMSVDAVPGDHGALVARFRQTRSELAAYIDAISAPLGRTGFTVYDVLGASIATHGLLENAPRPLQTPRISEIDKLDRRHLDSIRDAGSALEKAWREAGEAGPHWRGLKILNVNKFTADSLMQLAEEASLAFDRAAGAREALTKFAIDRNALLDDLTTLQTACESPELLQSDLNLRLISRIYRSSNVARFKEFLEACHRARSWHHDLTQVVSDPDEPGVSDRLRQIAAICAENSIDSIDPEDWHSDLTAREKTLTSVKYIHDELKPMAAAFPSCIVLPLHTIRDVEKFVRATSRDILGLRNETTADANTAALINRLIRTGRELRARQEAIAKAISVSIDLSPSELLAHAANLRNAGFLGWLKPSFRAAKHAYITHSRRREFKKGDAIRDLQELAEWKDAQRRFSDDPQGQALFGMHFRGIDSDFDVFDSLLAFYRDVEHTFPGATNRDVRKMLYTADLDLLNSIPEIADGLCHHIIADLALEIERLNAELTGRKVAINKLQGLVTPLLRPSQISVESLTSLADRLERLAELKVVLDKDSNAGDLLDDGYAGRDTDPNRFWNEMRAVDRLPESDAISGAIMHLLESNLLRDAISVLAGAIERDVRASTTLAHLAEETGIPFAERLNDRVKSEVAIFLRDASQDRDGLYVHSRFAAARAGTDEVELGWVVDALEQDGHPLDDVASLMKAVVFRALAIRAYEVHGSILSRYQGGKIGDLRTKLAKLDRESISLARQHLRSEIRKASKPLSGNGTGKKSTWTQMALIENEISKKRRYIPVRDLTRRAGRALLELKPCWMMSPLAVAQYLPLDELKFDLCIIDEASQMPPEDAVGALARSDQAMVVGDTNQLPPTSFFRKILDDGDEDEDGAVLEESVLEMANGAFRPARRLRWHYRSRHSGLIKFSNRHVYNDTLIVFPSASESRPDMGVSLVTVPGRYNAGVNSAEASAMIEAALRFMRRQPDRSLGIVTLNQKQRDLLLEEMETALSRDAIASKYVEDWLNRNDGLESFFIKNLENVQGDERDVIFIGTVYGPERPGAPIMQRFGPINGLAGKRRLNVLFSRAKQQIVTFSSMTAADIRADEHGNPGVYMLKCWLEYAATGVLHGGEVTEREPDSEFELFVINQLHSMGCEPVPQVGVAGYYIDIGVKHPEWPHGYIMGVECDGAMYHSSRSARDRDRLREEVLGNLGWKLHRIWSTDWFNDPTKQSQRLRAAIEDRLRELREKMAGSDTFSDVCEEFSVRQPLDDRAVTSPTDGALKDQSREAADLFAQTTQSDYLEVGDWARVRYLTGMQTVLEVTLSDERNDPAGNLVHIAEPLGSALVGSEEGDEIEVLVENSVRKAIIECVVKAKPFSPGAGKSVAAHNDSLQPAAETPQLQQKAPTTPSFTAGHEGGRGHRQLDPGRFYDPDYRPTLEALGYELIDKVGPVTFRHLTGIIARAHGFRRTGSQIKKHVWAAVRRAQQSKAPNGEVIFWPNGAKPAEAIPFRGLKVEGEERTWWDVPYPEQLGLAIDTIKSCGSRDVVAAMAACIGFARLKQKTREELQTLIDAARRRQANP